MTVEVDGGVATALAAVAGVMRDARDPWWVIGNAAVALHGAVTDVADIDLLVSERDAIDAVTRLGLTADKADPHSLFRSRIFARWTRPDRSVDIMGGFAICQDGAWRNVMPITRVSVGDEYLPDRTELMAILTRFGRAKDLERQRLLDAL